MMKIQYFAETDTLLVTFREAPIAETKELDENTLIDIDEDGNRVSITFEHAKNRADIANFPTDIIGRETQRPIRSGELMGRYTIN